MKRTRTVLVGTIEDSLADQLTPDELRAIVGQLRDGIRRNSSVFIVPQGLRMSSLELSRRSRIRLASVERWAARC